MEEYSLLFFLDVVDVWHDYRCKSNHHLITCYQDDYSCSVSYSGSLRDIHHALILLLLRSINLILILLGIRQKIRFYQASPPCYRIHTKGRDFFGQIVSN